MNIDPLTTLEQARLAALRVLDILDTPAEPAFDRIAALARAAFGAPVALVGFLDEDRHWFKAREGVDLTESPRSISFCTHAIEQDGVLWVSDAREDPRFWNSPLVAEGPGVRFYAGAPVVGDGGERVGTVCVLGQEPRPYDPALAELLTGFAQMASDQLELRRHRRMRQVVGNLIGSTSDAMICADRHGRITLWNSAATAVFGWTSAEAIGRSLDLIVPAGMRDAHNGGFGRLMSGGEPKLIGSTVEVPAVHKDGREIPVELSLSMWGSGEDRGAGAVIRDISQRKAAEEELRRTRDQAEVAGRESAAAHDTVELVVRSATTPLVMTDRKLCIIDVSDRWSEHYGLDREAVVGRSIHEVFPGARDRWDPIYRRCLAGARERGESSSTLKGEDGRRWFQWDVAPWRDASGDVAGLLLTNHDVSALVHAKEEVERDRRRLAMAVDIADLVVWNASFHDRKLHVTGSPEVLFGFPLSFEAVTDPEHRVVHPDDRAKVEAAWRRHLAGEGPFRVEHRTNRPDGEVVWVSSRLEMQRDGDGKPIGVIGVLTDITRRKTWEIETRRAQKAAESANRAKTQFLANMSHEVRTPLNGVLGVARVLAFTPMTDDQAAMVSLIEDSALDLERLLTGMLELVRLDAGEGEVLSEPMDLAALVRDLAAAHEEPARRKGLTLAVEAPAAAPCLGDPARVRRILEELADNAVKFTGEGSVTFGLTLTPARERLLARISVQDTGLGFDPDAADALFERFRQADDGDTRRYGGSGLGLSLCRSLADAMGGSVEARSTPGQGSTFTLVLELDTQPAAQSIAA